MAVATLTATMYVTDVHQYKHTFRIFKEEEDNGTHQFKVYEIHQGAQNEAAMMEHLGTVNEFPDALEAINQQLFDKEVDL